MDEEQKGFGRDKHVKTISCITKSKFFDQEGSRHGSKLIKNEASGAEGSIVLGTWAEFGAIGKMMIFRSVKIGQTSSKISSNYAQRQPSDPKVFDKVHTLGVEGPMVATNYQRNRSIDSK